MGPTRYRAESDEASEDSFLTVRSYFSYQEKTALVSTYSSPVGPHGAPQISLDGFTKPWGHNAMCKARTRSKAGLLIVALAVRRLAAGPSLSYRPPTILPLGRWPLLRSTNANRTK